MRPTGIVITKSKPTTAKLQLRILDIVGEAATKPEKRLDLTYGQRKDDDGRKFSGLHETVFQLCSKTRSIFESKFRSAAEYVFKESLQAACRLGSCQAVRRTP